MGHEHRLEDLIDALRGLPGIGQKSAQRIAFHLLQHDREAAGRLARALDAALGAIGHCERCHTLSEQPVCATCRDDSRDAGQLMVVETPADQAAIERTASYRGLYFVLMGRLKPLEGRGLQELGVQGLLERAADQRLREAIIATSFTAEGEATAHVLAQALKARGLAVTRLARGVPAGSELEYVDLSTLAHALNDRR